MMFSINICSEFISSYIFLTHWLPGGLVNNYAPDTISKVFYAGVDVFVESAM